MSAVKVTASAPNAETGLIGVRVTALAKMPGWSFVVTVQPQRTEKSGKAVPPKIVGDVVISPPADRDVRADQFRRIPYGEIFRLALGVMKNPMISLVAQMVGAEIGPRPYGGSLEHLRGVATVYRTALTQDLPPRETVAETYGISLGTVDRYLKDARTTTDPTTDTKILGTYRDELAQHGFSAAMKASRSPKTTDRNHRSGNEKKESSK